MAARNLENMTPEELADKIAALKPAWAQDYIRKLEKITRHLAAQLAAAQAQGAGDLALAGEISGARDRLAAQVMPSTWPPEGIEPPSGDWTVVRVLDGAANMEPLADLTHQAEIRFVDEYQVHYGSHESTGGARVLIVETGKAMQIRPVSPHEALIIALSS